MPEDMREPTRSEVAERMTTRISNSLVIAAAVLAFGIYGGSGDTRVEAPNYQTVATPDGRVVRVNTENGSIVSCDAARCTLIHLSGDDLDRAEAERRALSPPAPAPATSPTNEAAPPALPAPQPGAAQPAPPAAQPQR